MHRVLRGSWGAPVMPGSERSRDERQPKHRCESCDDLPMYARCPATGLNGYGEAVELVN